MTALAGLDTPPPGGTACPTSTTLIVALSIPRRTASLNG